MDEILEMRIKDFVQDALSIDGEHHKQWYLQRIRVLLGLEDEGQEEGIAP